MFLEMLTARGINGLLAFFVVIRYAFSSVILPKINNRSLDMKRYSRAGRKLFIRSLLRIEWRKNKKAYFTVGQIARKMGMKSSTHLKNILKEMSYESEEIIHLQQGGMDMWRFQPYEQTSFLDRIPVIKSKGIEYPVEAKSILGQLS